KVGIEIAGPDAHQAVGMVVGERVEKDAVEHAEDGGVDADAQGEREQGDACERGAAAEAAPGIADILGEDLKERAEKGVAHPFLDLLQSFKLDARGAARTIGRHAPGDVLVHHHLVAGAKLLVQLVFPALAGEKGIEASPHRFSPPIRASSSWRKSCDTSCASLPPVGRGRYA